MKAGRKEGKNAEGEGNGTEVNINWKSKEKGVNGEKRRSGERREHVDKGLKEDTNSNISHGPKELI